MNEIQRENSLDPVAGQNSGFNPDPAQTNSGTIDVYKRQSLGRIPALRDDLEALPGSGEMLESIRSRMGCFDELDVYKRQAL